MQILIVDANKAVSITLKKFLTKIGHNVTKYSYIEEMVSRLPSPLIPELALLDVNIDNMEYRRALQNFHRYYPEALIVIMTDNRMVIPTKDAIKCGIQSFLHKPFDFQELELLLLRSKERNKLKPNKRLAISHSVIVEKHGGSISVESEEGKGTTFSVKLPIDN